MAVVVQSARSNSHIQELSNVADRIIVTMRINLPELTIESNAFLMGILTVKCTVAVTGREVAWLPSIRYTQSFSERVVAVVGVFAMVELEYV